MRFLRFLGMAMLLLGMLALLCCGLLRLDSDAAWLAWLKPVLEWIDGAEGAQPVQWLRSALRWLRDRHEAAAWLSIAASFLGAALFTGARSRLQADEEDAPPEPERVALPASRDEAPREAVASAPQPVPAIAPEANAREAAEVAQDALGLYAPGRVYAPIQPARSPAWMEAEPSQTETAEAPHGADEPMPVTPSPRPAPDAYADYTPNEVPYSAVEPYELSPRIRSTIPRRRG